MLKLIPFLFFMLLAACNQNADTIEDKSTDTVVITKNVPPEDSITVQLRGAVTAIETKELHYYSKIRSMSVNNIRHEMISMKAYYQIQKEQLKQSFHLSSNKEKTTKALAYLDLLIAKSSLQPTVFKVQFHLNALFSNSTSYNEEHIKYLKEDFSEISIIFP